MFREQDLQRFQGVKNVGGTAAPAYAVLKRGDFEADTGLITFVRPTADDMDPVVLLLNGPQAIEPGGRGEAVDPTWSGLALVNGPPPLYGGLGTRADQWYLQSGGTGFTCLSSVTGGAAVVKPGGNTIVGVVCGTGGTGGNVIGRTLTTA